MTPSSAIITRLVAAFMCALAVSSVSVQAADNDIAISRIRGTVSYGIEPANPHVMFGTRHLPADAWVITGEQSLAEITYPDSSIVVLGPNTRIQIGKFADARSGRPNTAALMTGTIHFVIRHLVDITANYVFHTPLAQMAVRGTSAAVSSQPDKLIVSCTEGNISASLADGTLHNVPAGKALVVERDTTGNVASRIKSATLVDNATLKDFH